MRPSRRTGRFRMLRCQGAPRTCRCIETIAGRVILVDADVVREHHAPVGALRRVVVVGVIYDGCRQGAPRTCRCIETCRWCSPPSRCHCQGAPRTCGCIETHRRQLVDSNYEGQGAPRTCRCIETILFLCSKQGRLSRQGAPRSGKPGIGPRVRRSPMCNPCT